MIKNEVAIDQTFSPIISLQKHLLAVETSFDLICHKTLCCLSPTPVMLQNLIETGHLASEIFEFECVDDADNGRQTIAIL